MANEKKTCFVIIGFGPKTDFETGNVFDLDKTFENLIKPAFDELDINCFRAKEIRHSGNIDVPMYEWILKADLVVADISTLNPNALYELGVRHALRPNSTIVISEDQTKYPFDLNHTLISKYEHLGKDIGVSEAKRFKTELKALVKEVLSTKKTDSPVYTHLSKLIPPKFKDDTKDIIIDKKNIQPSLSELISDAENAKDNNEFWVAGQLYKVCLKFEPQNSFLRQRLALCETKVSAKLRHKLTQISHREKLGKDTDRMREQLLQQLEESEKRIEKRHASVGKVALADLPVAEHAEKIAQSIQENQVVIIAGETAQFGQPEINLGIIPGAGGTQRLIKAVGKSVAMKMVLTGEFITASEAKLTGLVAEVVSDEICIKRAIKLAETIANKPSVAVMQAKNVLLQSFENHLDSGLLYERKAFTLLAATQDRNEGIDAFINKRKPYYKGC